MDSEFAGRANHCFSSPMILQPKVKYKLSNPSTKGHLLGEEGGMWLADAQSSSEQVGLSWSERASRSVPSQWQIPLWSAGLPGIHQKFIWILTHTSPFKMDWHLLIRKVEPERGLSYAFSGLKLITLSMTDRRWPTAKSQPWRGMKLKQSPCWIEVRA